MEKLINIVKQYSIQGACCCGRCADAIPNPEQHQPEGVDLTFFRVGVKSGLMKEDFLAAVKEEAPQYLDGKEHSFIEIGGDIGDQGFALALIGVGHELGVWKALSPNIVMPFLPDALKQKMAGSGMVSLKYETEKSNEKIIH